MRPVRTEQIERYKALPLPTTTEEAWRFTDLRGFDPDAFTASGEGASPERMLDVEVAGLATVTESGIVIDQAPEGITFAKLEDHPRLYDLVAWDEKFAAHNAALWQNGLLVVVPKGVELD